MKKISFFCIVCLFLSYNTSFTGKRKKQNLNSLINAKSKETPQDNCKNYCFITGTVAFNVLTTLLALQSTSYQNLDTAPHFNHTR